MRAKIGKSKSDTSTNAVTIACSDTDTFEGGSTTQTLLAPGENLTVVAQTVPGDSGPVWVIEDHTVPRDILDLRYPKLEVATNRIQDANLPQSIARTATPILPKFRKALALTRLNHSATRVLCVRDSTTAGVFSDSYATATGTSNQGGPNSYHAQLVNRLNDAGIPSQYGLAIPGHGGNLDSRWSIGTAVYQALGAGNNSALALTSGSITVTPGVKADTYKIWFAANSGTGQATAQATGGRASAAFGSYSTASTYSVTIITAAEVSGDVLLVGAFPHPAASSSDGLNEALRTARGLPARPYVDLFQRYGYSIVAQGMMTADGVRPNALGSADAASAVAGLIRSL